MSKHKYIFIALLMVCFLGLGLFTIALAQEDTPMANEEMTDEEMLPMLNGEIGPPPEEVIQDMDISIEDLGASEAIVLPDSIFHPFKRLGRNITEIFTFDPIKDAELKLKHANQELSEMKQLVDEEGMENIDSDDLVDSVEWFEGKMEKIKDASEKLKEEKTDNPEEIEAFLNELTDKQFKEHKVLEVFHKGITDHKEEIDGSEEAFAALKDNQDNVFKHFGETLIIVDDPEKIPERLSDIADGQEGSSFKLIKAAEILEKLEEQVPDEAKEAIELAQERTFEKLQEDVAELPAIVRAEKFEEYANALPGDETVQLGIFERLKQLPDIPQDILEKIEEVKEFAVKRFEDKIEKFESSEVKDKFFANLQGNDLDDIMALEELKAKITAKQEALMARIDQQHLEGVEVFKKQFTDVKSQDQAERFERLVKEMTTNPSPTVLRLIQALETEVAQDVEKRAFIEDVKNKTKAEFENRFRLEGERFFDRMATFNPEDMMVFRDFEEEDFFDSRMIDQFYDHQTNRFKEHIQGIENPEIFNRFDERIRFAPPEVISMIKIRDNEFGDIMQFKARKMMEMEMELKEREMRMAMERAWRDSEDDFQLQLRQVGDDMGRAQLYEEKRERDLSLMEIEFEERERMMEARFENDPFCDSMCQEFQRISMEQDMMNKKWNLQEDARMREFEMEMQMQNQMQHDPFAGKCNSPESCMNFCNQNPNFSPCQMHGPIQPGMYDPGMQGPPPCPPGEINMPAGPGNWICTYDPYFKSPDFFKQCPPGEFWNEERGFCQFDEGQFMPPMPGMPGPGYPMPSVNFCGPGEYWDNMRGCVRDNFKQCPAGHFFDFFEKRCVPEWQSCPPGEYYDPGRNSCIRDVVGGPVPDCPPGEFFDFFKRQCIREIHCPTIMPRLCEPGEMPSYDECGPSCMHTPTHCPPGDRWDDIQGRCVGGMACPTFWEPVCGLDGVTYSNECFAKQAGAGVKRWGECEKSCGTNICSGGLDCVDYGRSICCQPGQLACPDNRCAWSMTDCEGYVPPTICPSGQMPCADGRCVYSIEECGTATGYCGDHVCQPGEYCPMDCETVPVPGCNNFYDSSQCTKEGCVWCNDSNACYNPGHSCSYMTECNNNGTCDYNENMESCPSDCQSQCISCYCGNDVCDPGETISNCPNDCGEYTYPGDAGSCPGFAYSRWDQNNTRYCQLNTQRACNYNYPDYLTESNYSEGICPEDAVDTACDNDGYCDSNESMDTCPNDCDGGITSGCGIYTDSSSCYADSACSIWCEGESTPYSCFSQGHVCGEETVCPSNSYTADARACDYTACPNGCILDSAGCPSGCATTDETTCSSMGGTCCSTCADGSYISGTECNCCGTCSSDSCPSSSYTTDAGACDYTMCPSGCAFDSAGCPSGCMTSGTACDNDYYCDSDETPTSCPGDCDGGTTGMGCGSYTDSSSCNADSACGVWCEGESTPYSCFSPGHVCGDNTVSYYCGDGVCEGDEDSYSCETDCGAVIACGDGSCDSSEDSYSCPSDCGPVVVCGDGYCDSGEDEYSCSSDCYVAPSYVCGDGVCEGDEYCPGDCGGGEDYYEEPYNDENYIEPPASIFRGIGQFFQRLFGF